MKREAAERLGHRGETTAAWWLRLHGWRIIGRRVKLKIGEVDIIAKRGRTVAFVEVKTRASAAEFGTAIDSFRLRRVAAATRALAAKYASKGEDIRIDVILVAPWRLPVHLVNVWQE